MPQINLALDQIIQSVGISVGAYFPNIVGALLVLIIGWLAALILAALVQGALKATKIDNRIAAWAVGGERARSLNVERMIGKGVFYFSLLFVLVAFFNALDLQIVAEPLSNLLNQVFEYIPRILGASLLLLAAWIIANLSKIVVKRVLGVAKLDRMLEKKAGLKEGKDKPLTSTLAEAVYWIVFLLFLPAILDVLEIQGLLGPVQQMTNQILVFLPNIFAAGLLVLIGWFGARIVQRIVTNLLASIGVDKLSARTGIAPVLGSQKLSSAVGTVVYILILIPVLIAALNALALEAVTRPASNMLNTILGAIPAIFGALVVLILSYMVGRVVAGLVANLLKNVGFDAILAKIGWSNAAAKVKDDKAPSTFVGYLVLVGIMLFATIEAFGLLGFDVLADLTAQFIVLVGHIVFGLVILAIGTYFANLAAHAVKASGAKQSGFLSMAARVSILLLAGAMALRQMGLANEIITLGFGLILGAFAVALALALGLGGRDVAAKHIDGWLKELKKK